MRAPTRFAFSISLILAGAFPSACRKDPTPDLNAEITRLKSELEGTRKKLAETDKGLDAAKSELALAKADAANAAKKRGEEQDRTFLQKDGQIRVLQQELADTRKNEGFAFAQISALQPKGLTTLALSRYQQFIKDYPDSPLVADANRAIAELSVTAQREARAHANIVDPKRAERELLKNINEGGATLDEIAPLLKDRSLAGVIKLLGRPSRTYRDGAEIGYTDRVIDPVTRAKETLVISFDSDKVSGLRAGYLGKEIKP
jgi:hypothetical protein